MLSRYSKSITKLSSVYKHEIHYIKPQILGTNIRFYSTKKSNHKNKKTDTETSFIAESDEYILKELKKEIKQFKSKNQQIPQIIAQFKDILALYDLEFVQCPISLNLDIQAEKTIHLRKNSVEGVRIDLLIDFKTQIDDSREIQVVLTNDSEIAIYMMGSFTKANGFCFDSCMVIDQNGKEIRDAICNGNPEIFKSLNNHYHKLMNISDERVLQFLSIDETDPDAIIPEFDDSRMFLDAMVNYTVVKMLGIQKSDVEGTKLRSIIWMLGTYCENALFGDWLEKLSKFIEKK